MRRFIADPMAADEVATETTENSSSFRNRKEARVTRVAVITSTLF